MPAFDPVAFDSVAFDVGVPPTTYVFTNPLYDGNLHLWIDDAWPPETAGYDWIANQDPIGGAVVTDLRFTTVCPGGFGDLSFSVSTSLIALGWTAYCGYYIKLVHGTQTLWEGRIAAVVPVAGSSARVEFECGGFLDTGRNRNDYHKVWSDGDEDQWRTHPRTAKRYETEGGGLLRLCASKGTTYPAVKTAALYYEIADGVGDFHDAEGIKDVTFDWAVDLGSNWHVRFYYADRFYYDWADWDWETRPDTHNGVAVWEKTNLVDTGSASIDLGDIWNYLTGDGVRAIAFRLFTDSESVPTADRYAEIKNVLVGTWLWSNDGSTVDAALLSIAKDIDESLTADTETIGGALSPLVIRPSTTPADALAEVGNMAGSRVDWCFYEDRTFRARAFPTTIPPARKWLLDTEAAGISSQITQASDRQIDAVQVLYGAIGTNQDYPRGKVRSPYRPAGTIALSAKVDVLDYSDRVLGQTAAADAGDQYLEWRGSDVLLGSPSNITGFARRGDGETRPSAYVRASDYVVIEGSDTLITATEYDVTSATLTISVGSYAKDFKRARNRRWMTRRQYWEWSQGIKPRRWG